KQRWRAGTPVPITVRLPSGGGFSGGPFHSQNPESSFAHIPGLKIVCPATPEDAKGLLVTAIQDPNPVLYFEHKHLYRRIKAEEAFEDLDAPVKRIAAPDTPVPFSPALEKAFIPQVEDVAAGLRELAEY